MEGKEAEDATSAALLLPFPSTRVPPTAVNISPVHVSLSLPTPYP